MILKQKLKIGLLLVWVALLFVACEYDEKTVNYHTQDHAEKHLKVSKVNFNQLQNNKKLMDRLGKLKNTTQQTAARIIQSNDNSFYIDTDFAYLIESENGKHSYTFEIISQDPQYRLENLIVKENNTDGYNLYIAQYDITELEYEQLQNGENPSLINKLNIVPVANNIINTTNILNRGSAEGMCLTETVVPGNICPEGYHSFDDITDNLLAGGNGGCNYFVAGTFTPYKEQVVYSWGPCGDDGGGGDPIDDGNYDGPDGGYPGGSGDGTPPTDGSGTSDPANPPDNTDPNPDNSFEDTEDPVNTTPVVEEEEYHNPCDKIKNETSSNNYKTKFKALTNNYNLSHETGFVEKEINGVKEYVDCVPNGQNMVTPPQGSKNITHVHQNLPKTLNGVEYDGRAKIFSIGDLFGLIRTLQANNPNPKDAFCAMLSDEGVYAITILEPIIITPELMIAINEMNEKIEIEEYNIIKGFYSESVRKEKLQKMFLKSLKKLGLENKIALFEANIENENAADINDYKINWSRIELKKVFLGIKPESTPCN